MTDSPEPPSPPNKQGDPNNSPAPSFAWRLFFGFYCLIVVLNLFGIPLADDIGLIEVIDFVITNVAFVGLCGFIFYKPIGSVVFWRYFFYFALIEAIIVLGFYPLFNLPVYGRLMTWGDWLFSTVLTFFSLLAINLYAYKKPDIWWKDPRF